MNPTLPSFAQAFVASVLALGAVHSGSAQQWVNPHYDTHRLDYRDLGYPQQNLIPADDSFVTALLTHSNGLVYGATSGRGQSYLFVYNRYLNKVRPLGKIAEAKGVYHTLLEGPDGSVYVGGGLSMFAPVRLTKKFPVEFEGVEKQLWKDITQPYAAYPGGHLYRYLPSTGDTQRYTNDHPCPVEDLGVPVPGNTIYAMTWSADRKMIYGVSYPDARLFAFDLATRKSRDLGALLAKRVYGGPERPWRSVPRALWCDAASGCIYTSGDNGWLVRFNPATDGIEITDMRLPGEYWESLKSADYPVVEAFTQGRDGRLFAGTSDGTLLRVDLKTHQTEVLGKPRVQRRMRALAAGHDGKLYLVCGETDMMCKLYSYEPASGGGFHDLGILAVDRSPYYAHRAYRLDAMAIGADGTVFIGESDRRGKLFLYTPGAAPFPGDMNPANPTVDRMRPGTPALIPEAL